MMDDLPDLEGAEVECSQLIAPFIINMMAADEMIEKICIVFLNIADTYMAFDNQHKGIMNIIQHSLSDYKNKAFK